MSIMHYNEYMLMVTTLATPRVQPDTVCVASLIMSHMTQLSNW